MAGTELPAEAKVLLMYGSANHDERHYERPDEFVIDRYPRGFADSDHVSFTTGIHVCLGGHLARLLINVFLERMAERIDAIEIAGPVVRSSNALVRVIDDLPGRAHSESSLTQFFANLLGSGVEPVAWARQREAEGWDGIGVTDHLWAGTTPFSHWAVTLGQLAAVTERVTLLSCFANNLLRSPVEFAQAALALQRASGGRFEAGLGAGWSQEEIEGIGACFPPPAVRAGALRRSRPGGPGAVRDRPVLVRRRALPGRGPRPRAAVEQAPPIVVSVGGPRTIREIAPLADRVEIAFNAAATRGGGPGLAPDGRARPGPPRRPRRAGDGEPPRTYRAGSSSPSRAVTTTSSTASTARAPWASPGWPARRTGSRPPCSSSSTTASTASS